MDGSHRVHLSEADYIVEGEHEPLPVRTYKEPTAVEIEIAKHVVKEIPDGAVLSLAWAACRSPWPICWRSRT